MSSVQPLPYRAALREYQRQAEALWDALKSADPAARWRFKWEHPHFRGKPVSEVRAMALDLDDAQLVVAHEYGFENWVDLAEFTDAVRREGSVDRFETAVEAVISGDLTALRSMLRENPELVHARSMRRHHATLLHLVERGARLDIKGTIHDGTPLDWAIHGERTAIAEYLREQGAPAA